MRNILNKILKTEKYFTDLFDLIFKYWNRSRINAIGMKCLQYMFGFICKIVERLNRRKWAQYDLDNAIYFSCLKQYYFSVDYLGCFKYITHLSLRMIKFRGRDGSKWMDASFRFYWRSAIGRTSHWTMMYNWPKLLRNISRKYYNFSCSIKWSNVMGAKGIKYIEWFRFSWKYILNYFVFYSFLQKN